MLCLSVLFFLAPCFKTVFLFRKQGFQFSVQERIVCHLLLEKQGLSVLCLGKDCLSPTTCSFSYSLAYVFGLFCLECLFRKGLFVINYMFVLFAFRS